MWKRDVARIATGYYTFWFCGKMPQFNNRKKASPERRLLYM